MEENREIKKTINGEKAEVNIRHFYSRPWNFILRYTNNDKELEKKVKQAIVENAVLGANNPHIGYSMSTSGVDTTWTRSGFYHEVAKVNYDVNKLTTDCNTDCSAFVGTIVTIVGHKLGIDNLTKVGIPSTYYMRTTYTNVGFVAFTDSKYLTSTQYLEPGDILVNTASHTAIYVGESNNISGQSYESSGVSWPSLEIDDTTINLDEINFDFAGSPKNVTYSGERKLGIWIFSKISEFLDYIASIIINGIKYSILGYAMAFESIVNNAIRTIEGT